MSFFHGVVKRPVLTTVTVLIAVLLGALAYTSLGLRRFPDIEFPVATVTTIYPGGSPEEVETEITKTIEDSVSSISGIEKISSNSQQGVSMVFIQFKIGESIDVKAEDVRDKVNRVRVQFPDDAKDPVVEKFDISGLPVMTLALIGPQDINELYRVADEVLQERIAQLSGVASVTLTGGQRREIQVLLDQDKLRGNAISVDEVARAVQATNIDVPAGHITEPGYEYQVRTIGRFAAAGQIESVTVPTRGEGTVRIGDLGKVRDTFEEARTASRADGENSIVLTLMKQRDANEVEVPDRVKALLPELEKLLPAGARIIIVEDASVFVRGSLANVRGNMVIGILLTGITLWLFLGSLRGVIIAGAVIPSSVVIAFTFLLFSGFSLNMLTLVALALSVGIVVNNSIMVLENAERLIAEGMTPEDAAVRGTKDIALPIIASTATNLVVFIPLAYMGEIIGRFMKEFGLTIVYVTIVSIIVSFTLTPMMCAKMLRAAGDPPRGVGRAIHALTGWIPRLWVAGYEQVRIFYMDILEWCLRRPKTAILLTVAAVVGSVFLLKVIGMEFMPRQDEGRFRVTVEAPLGSSLAFTDERVREVEEQVRATPYLKHYYSRVGQISGFLGSASGGVSLAEIGVTVADKADRTLSLDDILNKMRPGLAGIHSAKLTASPSGGGGPGGSPIQVEITGVNIAELQRVVEDVVRILKGVPGATDVDQSWRTGLPEVQITPREEALGRHGLTAADVALTVRTYLEGRAVSEFREAGQTYNIVVKLSETDRQWADVVKDMFIKSPATGQMVPISQLAEVKYGSGPVVITRKDRRRLITVSANLTGEKPLGAVNDELKKRVDKEVQLPKDVDIYYGGQSEFMGKNFRELFKAMGTAVVLTLLCTAGIIESFLFSGLIILSVPISVPGVVLAMLIWGDTINMFSLMAMIMVIGMLVNNAIIILDYAASPDIKHLPVLERIREACRVRFRMIVMTNLTNIAGMFPLSLGLGFAGEIFRPLAIAQIGGFIASSTLALLVIPAMYVLVEGFREKRKARKAGSSKAAGE